MHLLPISQMLDIYAILREMSTMPINPPPEQIGRLWAQSSFQADLLKIRLGDAVGDVEVGE